MSESNPGNDLAGSFEAALPSTPKVASNWGMVDDSRPLLPRRWLVVAAVMAILLVAPLIFLSFRQTSTPARDDAYRTLDAYAQAKISKTPLDEGLSPQELALLSSASRVESSDEVLLTLRTGSTCWSVPLEPQEPAPAPKEAAAAFCQ
jgi:hypothetical protein